MTRFFSGGHKLRAALASLLCGLLIVVGLTRQGSAQIVRDTDPAALALLDRGVALGDRPQQAVRERFVRQCSLASPRSWPGLELRDGKVVGAELLQEIEGFAREAETTGGLGGELFVVTTVADNARNEPVLLGSLRAGIEKARRDKAPLWIVFSPALGTDARIILRQDIRPPDNVTIDGSCAGVFLDTDVDTGCILVAESKNVILTRLACRARDYTPEAGDGARARSGFRLNGSVDRIAILHNDLSQCGDGCLDITISPNRPLPDRSRITVAFNRFADHNKVMLFGPLICGNSGQMACDDPAYAAAFIDRPPVLSLTLLGNLFLRTAQRHPRIYGPVMAHAVANVVGFAAMWNAGRWGSGYGMFVSGTARALVEHNVFVPLDSIARRRQPWSVWTTNSAPGAERMREAEGSIRLNGNVSSRPSVLAENEPARVPTPVYWPKLRQPAVDAMPIEQAIGCVAARAGRFGDRIWEHDLCGL